MKGDRILDIKEDNKSRLWLATSGFGLTYYDYKTNCFTLPNINYKNSQNQVLKIAIDTTNSTIWVATDGGGVFSYNYLTKRKKDYSFKNNNNFNSNVINSIEIFDGIVFAGNTKGEMLVINPQSGFVKVYPVSESKITSIKKYKNKFLIGTVGNGYFLYDSVSNKKFQYILDKNKNEFSKNNVISSIFQTTDSTYILTRLNGIVYINIKNDTINITKTINKESNKLEYDSFTTVFVDSKSTEWFGSNGFGLFYKSLLFNSFKTLKNTYNTHNLTFSSVRTINIIDSSLWIGGYNGLNSLNINSNLITEIPAKDYDEFVTGWTKYISTKAIYTTYLDPFNNDIVWIGSEGNGLHKYSKSKKKFKSIKIGTNYGSEENINSVFCFDQYEKNLILGTTNGIYVLEPSTETYSRLEGINKKLEREIINVRSLFVDGNYVYFVADGIDVFVYNLKLAKLEKLSNSFSSLTQQVLNSINSISSYNNSIVLCSKESGLYVLDNKRKTIKHFYHGNGLINNCVYEVLIEEDNILWASTNKGISKINLMSESITNYSSDIFGISTEFNLNASFKYNNNFYFGGTDGVVYFNPKDLINSKNESNIIIKSVELNDNNIIDLHYFIENDTININYVDDLVEIVFITNEYLFERSMVYTCKLNDEERTKVFNNRVKLKNIKEGLNKIEIDIYNSNGIITETKYIYINVNTPLWKSNWVYFIFIFLLLLFLTYIYINNTKKLKSKLLTISRENRLLQNKNDKKTAYLNLFENNSTIIIWQTDLDFNLRYSTTNLFNYYRINPSDNFNLNNIYISEDLEHISNEFKNKNNFNNKFEINIFHKQSIQLENEYSTVNVFKDKDDKGNLVGFIGVINDTTEKDRTKKELNEKEELFSTLVSTILEPILIATWEGEILFANKEAKMTLGIKQKDIPEKNLFDYTEQYNQELRKEVFSVKNGNSFQKMQFEFIVNSKRKKVEGNGTQITYLSRNLFLFTFRDVTERINLINELSVAKINAERSSELKTMYLSNLTHELKTPINAISGFTDILISKYTNSKNNHYLDSIKLSTNLLIQLINDLLYYTKAESGKLELRLAPTNLKSLILELESIFNLEIEKKGLKLNFKINNNGIDYHLSLDQLKFKQIIINLLNNSIKYTDKGKIDVVINLSSISESQIDLELIVEDTGKGIPKEKLHEIFNAFKQVNLSDEAEGFGLGLAIVSRILNTMNGEISVSSQINQGSKFTVKIKNINLVLNKSSNKIQVYNTKLVEKYITNDDKLNVYSSELLEELKIVLNGRFANRLKNIRTNFLLKDISDFAIQLNNLADEKEINFLIQYSNELLEASKTIEVEKINNLLENFYKLLELIIKLLEKKNEKE